MLARSGTDANGQGALDSSAVAQSRLSKREALLIEAERVAHLGSWTWNLQTNEIVWSDELYSIFGLDRASVPANAEHFFQAVHPEDRRALQDASERSLRSGVAEIVDYRIVRPNGEIRQVHMESAFLPDPDTGTIHVVGTVLDETDKRKAAILLARTVEELDEAHEMAGLGSWRWDLHEHRVEWTEGMYRIFGMAELSPA